MKKDPTEFRKRFQAWKDGKDVYEAGRPVELSGFEGGKDDELPEGFLFDTKMPELTVYGDVERARRQNNWLINRGQFPRFYSLGNGKGIKEIKIPTEKGLEIVSPEFYALAGLRPGGDIIAPITKNQLKSAFKFGSKQLRQLQKYPDINIKNVADITDDQWDQAYYKAIKDNNTPEIQRLRDLHFIAKSPNTKVIKDDGMPLEVYHGVNKQYDHTFNQFDPTIEGTHSDIYTVDYLPQALSYTGDLNSKRIKKLYLNLENPYIVEGGKRNWNTLTIPNRPGISLLQSQREDATAYAEELNKILDQYGIPKLKIKDYPISADYSVNYGIDNYFDDFIKQLNNSSKYYSSPERFDIVQKAHKIYPKHQTFYNVSTRQLEQAIRPFQQYDGIMYKDISDWGDASLYYDHLFNNQDKLYNNVFSVHDPKKLKYSDAITYDNDGKIIPLSKRDNFNINDLRYSWLPWFLGGSATAAFASQKGYADGKDSGIYIKPSHRGKFTALKKRTGHSASWFKAHGTPAQKKMATFALNARKWKH